jgi:hypothetical protein
VELPSLRRCIDFAKAALIFVTNELIPNALTSSDERPLHSPSLAYKNTFVLNVDPMVATVDQFLSATECGQIIDLARGATQRAKVSLDAAAGIIPGRSGFNCWLRYRDHPVVMQIGRRISSLVGIPLEHAESLQVIHYDPLQEYRAHYDAYDLTSPRGQRSCRFGHQRIVTVLLYLSDVLEGGSTAFPKLDLMVEPKGGRAVIFNNVDKSLLCPHPASLHAGSPVLKGEKWACNIWFHARPIREKQIFNLSASSSNSVLQAHDKAFQRDECISLSDSAEENNDDQNVYLRVNRASRLFAEALKRLVRDESSRVRSLEQVTCFSYWDVYRREPFDFTSIPNEHRLIKLIERRIFNPLSNKWTFFRDVQRLSLDQLVPWSCTTVPDALAYDSAPDSLWFIKPTLLSGGRGIRCIRGSELQDIELGENTILQRAVDDLLLWEGKKFTARIYVLIWNKSVFLYANGFILVHGVLFDDSSTDYAIHVDHRGYQDPASSVKMIPLSSCDSLNEYQSAFPGLVCSMIPIFDPCISASSQDEYILLGIDLLLQKHGGIKIVEINTMPNYIHSGRINQEVNVPLFADIVARLALGVERPSLRQISL